MKAVRRVVTGHDAAGRSVVLRDGATPKTHAVPGATFHELWSTAAMPAPVSRAEPHEPTERPLVTPPDPNGTIVRIVDFAPGSRSPMHRTETIDYGVVLDGEMILVLDDGSETPLLRGAVVVQRGTDHAWVNPGDEPARMVFVLVDGRFTDDLKALLGTEAALFERPLDG